MHIPVPDPAPAGPAPRRVIFLLLPGVNMLDLAGPMQAFHVAAQLGAGYSLAFWAAEPSVISADTFLDEKKSDSFYLVQVRTTSNAPARRSESLAIFPGMTATVHLQRVEKSFLQYLLKPIFKTKEIAFRDR